MMLTSIVILQILIKTKGELGEANRGATHPIAWELNNIIEYPLS